MSDTAGTKDLDQAAEALSDGAVPVVVMAEADPRPYAGIYSFADYDREEDSREVEMALSIVYSRFERISENILQSNELSASAKADRLEALAGEFRTRIEAAAADPDTAWKDAPTESGYTDPTDDPGTFVHFRDNDGELRWVTVHTNKFKDRGGEIFSDAAHREYVEHVQATGDYPVLRFWHIPRNDQRPVYRSSLDLGKADLVAYDSNGFVVASGKFYPDMLDVAERVATQFKDLGCSHGFTYRASDLKDGVISRYRTFEVTILPRPFEANTLTMAAIGREADMFDQKSRGLAVTIFGADRVARLEQELAGARAAAEAEGIAYRAVAEAVTEPVEAPAAEAAPAAEPAATEPVAAVADPAPAAAAAAATTEGSEPVPAGEEMPTPAAAAAPTDTQVAAEKGSTDAVTAVFQSIIEQAMQPVLGALNDLQARVKSIEGGVEAEIAQRVTPRVGPIGTKAASSAPETAVGEDWAAQFREAWGVKEQPAGAATSAGAPFGAGAAPYTMGILSSLASGAGMADDD